MKVFLSLAGTIAALAVTAPAHATGGLQCLTAGDRPIDLRLVISHAAVSAIASARLIDGGRDVPVAVAQSWLDREGLRLDLVDRNAERHLLRLRATASRHGYDGSLWRGGKRRWVRCREG